MTLRVLDRGTIDDRGCAFPQVAVLADGSMVCTYSNAGGQFATGGTDAARSADGRRWELIGTVLAASADPPSSNHLKVSRSPVTGTLFAYGTRSIGTHEVRFGERRSEAILCTSDDSAATWSPPRNVPMPTAALEISHGILALRTGRLIAPAATIEPGRLGERVIVAVSDDNGATWPHVYTAMHDPEGQCGYLEQKVLELDDGRILATAWTVTMPETSDKPNSYTLSDDGGETWTTPRSMGIAGQTLSAAQLGGDTFLLTYNRRYGAQGIVAAIARFDGTDWHGLEERLVYDARHRRDGRLTEDGVDEMLEFEFGFPTVATLRDGTYLLTHWSVDDGRCGVRWMILESE